MKDEGRLPTGSFKARGLVMAVSMAKALGIKHMAMPTNGNAGAAMAAYASRCGIRTTIFCPEDTPEINLSEIALEGAHVYRVNGLIDDCGKLVGQGKEATGWFDTSTLKEPYRIEGKKTMGLELAEQFGWDLPDVIFYPTGGGTGLIGMWKAFAELEAIGFIGSKRPRMVAVQAEGCAPMVRAWEKGEEHAPRFENAHTIASGIRVPQAVGDFLILRAVRESGGFAIAVSDEAIQAGVDEVAREEGFLMCPEGGATYAAYKAALADGRVNEDRPRRAVQLRHRAEISDAEGDEDAGSHQADRLCEAVSGVAMHVDPKTLSADESYKLLTGVVVPRPVAWVTTLSAAGGVNLAPFSTFTFVSPKPPMLAFSVGQRGGIYKDTARNILAIEEYVVHIADGALIEAVHDSAVEYPPEVSEIEMLGLATAPSLHVKPPRVVGRADRDGMPAAPVPRIRRHAQPPDRRRGAWRFISATACCKDGKIDTRALDPLCRLAGPNYATLGEIVAMQPIYQTTKTTIR